MKSAGRHLILDCVLSDKSLPIVSSTEQMSYYLEKVTEITGMTLVIPPIAMKFPFSGEAQRLVKNLEKENINSSVLQEFKQHIEHRDNEQGGVSAITVWLESHASLHSWPMDKYISIDLFSCKEFDWNPVLYFTNNYMKLTQNYVTIIDRKMDGLSKIEQFILEPDLE